MASVADFAGDFSRRASTGRKPVAHVPVRHAELFLGELARQGMTFARECLDQIRDERLRRVIETLFFASAGGAVLGAAIGGAVGGPAGAKAGALVGTAVGVGAAVFAIVITARQEEGPDGPNLVLTVR